MYAKSLCLEKGTKWLAQFTALLHSAHIPHELHLTGRRSAPSLCDTPWTICAPAPFEQKRRAFLPVKHRSLGEDVQRPVVVRRGVLLLSDLDQINVAIRVLIMLLKGDLGGGLRGGDSEAESEDGDDDGHGHASHNQVAAGVHEVVREAAHRSLNVLEWGHTQCSLHNAARGDRSPQLITSGIVGMYATLMYVGRSTNEVQLAVGETAFAVLQNRKLLRRKMQTFHTTASSTVHALSPKPQFQEIWTTLA